VIWHGRKNCREADTNREERKTEIDGMGRGKQNKKRTQKEVNLGGKKPCNTREGKTYKKKVMKKR